MWALALKFLGLIIGKLWGNSDARDREREAGERLGAAEVRDTVSTKEIEDAQKAVDAGRAARDADDSGRVRDRREGDRPFDPDGLG